MKGAFDTLIGMPPFARRLSESLMTDTVTWTRQGAVTGPIVIDPVTGLPTVPADVTVYAGPARFYLARIPRKTGGGMSAGDYIIDLATYASIPFSSPNLAAGDIGLITGSKDHPQDIGFRYTVIGLVRNTQASAQRFQVEAVVG